MQLAAVGQEMSYGPMTLPVHCSVPNEPGRFVTCQRRPFHRAAIRCMKGPSPGSAEPIAVQSERVTQDTELTCCPGRRWRGA